MVQIEGMLGVEAQTFHPAIPLLRISPEEMITNVCTQICAEKASSDIIFKYFGIIFQISCVRYSQMGSIYHA